MVFSEVECIMSSDVYCLVYGINVVVNMRLVVLLLVSFYRYRNFKVDILFGSCGFWRFGWCSWGCMGKGEKFDCEERNGMVYYGDLLGRRYLFILNVVLIWWSKFSWVYWVIFFIFEFICNFIDEDGL